MRKTLLAIALATTFVSTATQAASVLDNSSKAWTYAHNSSGGFLSEIVTFDSATNTMWVAGVSGVDVLNAATGAFIDRIAITGGSINSVAIHNGVAAFAIESAVRTDPGVVKLYDTASRSLLSGTHTITVGALPDMLTFTKDGSKLLVANEATPSAYGALTSASGTFPRSYGPAALDPVGSVSIINMATRTVTATANANIATTVTGSHLRTNTGMDFEPEYIAVNAAGTKAYVTLQEANGVGVLDMASGSFEKIIGLGAKDFNAPGNRIDAKNDSTATVNRTELLSTNAKGLYMPDGIATYEAQGQTLLVMANEGDFREDDADRSAASSVDPSLSGTLMSNLRVSNTDSSPAGLYAAGARSFSIVDPVTGEIVYDSGEILDREAIAAGIYDDGRSRDKGVEPEGIELVSMDGRTFALVGLERTLKAAIAVFDITDPRHTSFVKMLVSDGDRSPEGLKAFRMGDDVYLAFSNEVSNSTSVFHLSAVPEPETCALALAALGVIGLRGTLARRRA